MLCNQLLTCFRRIVYPQYDGIWDVGTTWNVVIWLLLAVVALLGVTKHRWCGSPISSYSLLCLFFFLDVWLDGSFYETTYLYLLLIFSLLALWFSSLTLQCFRTVDILNVVLLSPYYFSSLLSFAHMTHSYAPSEVVSVTGIGSVLANMSRRAPYHGWYWYQVRPWYWPMCQKKSAIVPSMYERFFSCSLQIFVSGLFLLKLVH